MAGKTIQPFAEIAAADPARQGDENEAIEHIQAFLDRFGYVANRSACTRGTLDDETSRALVRYQEAQGLTITGEFDEATRARMTTHRCAFPDRQNGLAFSTTCRWDKNEITYAFDTPSEDLPAGQAFQAVRNAFASWAAVIPVTFTEVDTDQNPDVRIGWRPADDPDLSMVGGALAHADFPPDCSLITDTLPKPVHFDDSEHDWVIGAVPDGFDVESVAVHEIGHILGLAHTDVSGAIMFPSISPNTTHRALQPDDISGAQSLYGSTSPPPDPPPPEPGRGGCFIATAAYGSELAPEVQFLRDIRDQVIRQMDWGRTWFERFESQYYRFSPAIAEEMKRDPELKTLLRWSIVEPWTLYMKLAVNRPDWDRLDWQGLDPDLRKYLREMRAGMESWLSEIELPDRFDHLDPVEAVRELNFVLTYVRRTGGVAYLQGLVDEGGLPLAFDPAQAEDLRSQLEGAGRSEREIRLILG